MQNSIEVKDIDNVIQKLQIHMQLNNQSMHGIANSIGLDYQPFYRLMTKKSLPTVGSLDHIAQKLNCTIAELIADDTFLDTQSFTSIENFLANKPAELIRVYVKAEVLQDIGKCIAIKTNINAVETHLSNISYILNTNVYQLFTITKKINVDGFFLVKYKKKITVLEVISTSSKIIIIKWDKNIIQVPIEDLEAYARFVTYIELPNSEQNVAYGKII